MMPFIFGLIGGLLVELLGAYKHLRLPAESRPAYYKSAFYWFVTLLMVISGGALAAIYSENIEISPVLAINIGASAPLLIGFFASNDTEIQFEKADTRLDVIQSETEIIQKSSKEALTELGKLVENL